MVLSDPLFIFSVPEVWCKQDDKTTAAGVPWLLVGLFVGTAWDFFRERVGGWRREREFYIHTTFTTDPAPHTNMRRGTEGGDTEMERKDNSIEQSTTK